MLRRALSLALGFIMLGPASLAGGARAADAPPAASFAEPAISPDHAEIAFVSGGDVWSVPAGGGTARLLTDTGGTAKRPLFSPDGTELAFASSRPGAAGIYVLALAHGTLRRLTYGDASAQPDAWSGDGRFIYFSTSDGSVDYENVIRRVPVAGGTPVNVRAETYVNQMDAAPAPGGRALAYVRDGFDQWWRRGHSHIDESEIVIERPAAHAFETAVPGGAKNRWPMWSPDGTVLYYVSDRGGSDQLWERRDGRSRALTALPPGRVLWPTISRDGHTIAFERGLAIWTYDIASGVARELAIEPRGLATTSEPTHEMLSSHFGAFDLSPDGKKLAFVARGTLFAADAQDGGEAQPAAPDASPAAADEPVWANDSRRVAFVLDRGDTQAIATYAFPDGPERIVTPAGHHDDYPHWSPDGTKLEFVRDGRELHVVDVASHADRVVATGTFDRRPFGEEDDVAFSSDGTWLAFVDNPPGGFSNAYVVRASGGPARALTDLPNTNAGPLAWSPDGTRLYLVTSQRTEDGAVAQIDLEPRAPRFREESFRHLFDELPPKPGHPENPAPGPSPRASAAASPAASPAAKATAEPGKRIDFTDIERRVTLLPTGLDVNRISVTPDSKTLVLDANAAGQQNLYAFSVDETSSDAGVATQLTNSMGPKARTRIAPDGRSVVYLDDGRFKRVGFDGRDAKPIAIDAPLDVDFERDKPLVFAQVWSTLDRWYADPHFNGVDWNAERRAYEAKALAAHTHAEFARILSLMIGELDSSHSGYAQRPAPPQTHPGRLGADVDVAAYERDGRVRFTNVLPLGPLALAGIKDGDELLAVGDTPVDARTNVDALLENAAGKRTVLRIAPGGDTAAARVVPVLPVDAGADRALRYRAWVAGRRAYVERVSGGRLGYVHLADMETEALERFYTDLDTQNRAKAGVVIDIRNNDGGFVDPYAIDVVARREYLRFKSRFGNDAPARTALGQRALDKPTALVVNAHTLSDGENFTEGYRRLGLGPVVGVPTAGWIIFTSEATLADGSQVRVPSTSVFTEGGVNMEQHPRGVDVEVDDSPAAAERGDDPQLDAAVRALERRIGSR
jgi:Tol biopolymer transport system component/C-terminal processing protease CtpA/Prc